MPLPRDQNYYFEDGSSIFRVEGCLFNIHYSLLAQESPFFNKMFSLPQPESMELNSRGRRSSGVEGSSDDNPVVCHDHVDSFRALCWGLYARPAEIRAQQDAAKVDLKRLILLAEIAHKYDCTNLEKCEVAPGLASDPGKIWTLEILEKLLLLSNEGDILDQTFKKKIEVQWLSLAFSRTKDSAGLRKSLDFADSLNNARQKGLAYYRALRHIGNMNSMPPVLSDFEKMVESCGMPDPLMSELTPEQRCKLMRGQWCLNSLRRYSRRNIAFNEPHTGCPSMGTHQYYWQNFWTTYQNVCGDLGVVLELAHERASKRNEWGVACWLELKPKIEEMIRTFEDNMSKYFTMD